MIVYMQIAGALTYLYSGIYFLGGVFAFLYALISGDISLIILSIVFVPFGLIFFLFAQAHFRMARRTENYLKFCKIHKLDNEKVYSNEFFAKFKLEEVK